MIDKAVVKKLAKSYSVQELRDFRRILSAELAMRSGKSAARREKVKTRSRG